MIKPKKTLQNIKPYAIERYYTDCALKLDSNENPYGASPLVIQAIRNFDPQKISQYPAYGELIDTLAGNFGAKPEQFILTNGCDEAIYAVLNAFLEQGDEVVSFSPTFSMPALYCDIIGAKFVEIEYNDFFEFEYEKFCLNIGEKTKILYLTSPNNPTGGVIPPETVEKIVKNYPNRLVVLDCTYFNFSQINRGDYFNLAAKYDNIAILKSFSKDYALAGLRLGYVFANKKIIDELKKIVSPYSVNAAAVCAGLAALSDLKYYNNCLEELNNSKTKLAKELNGLGYNAVCTSGNFVLCNFGPHCDFLYNKLLNHKIRVKYFKGIKSLKNTFRISAPKYCDIEKIISVLSSRPLFVFDLDGVVFDVRNSYRLAIKKTFEYFTGLQCDDTEIQLAKNKGGLSNDWDLTAYLIEKAGFEAEYNKLVKVFQEYFYMPEKGGMIDNEAVILDAEFFERLAKFADCAVFTGRPAEEAFYSLEKFGLKKYFSYFVCNEDVEGNFKPSPFGLNKIRRNCPHSEICYFGDTVDDIIAGKEAKVRVFGVIPPGAAAIDETAAILSGAGAAGIIKNKNEILEAIYANG